MKIKPFIFVFFLCSLIIISVVAIRPSKDEKQCIYTNCLHNYILLLVYSITVFVWFAAGATEESKTKIHVDKDGGRGEGGHDGDLGGGMHSNVDWETLEQEEFGEEPEGGGSGGGGGESGKFGEGEGKENEGNGGEEGESSEYEETGEYPWKL